jgi:hypothetical protein
MTDDGYGRYRPCDALYKQKHHSATLTSEQGGSYKVTHWAP